MADPVALKGKPNTAPEGVHAEWDFANNKIKVGWQIPSGATDDTNPYRWTSVDVKFEAFSTVDWLGFPEGAMHWKKSYEGDRDGVLITPMQAVHAVGIGLDTSFEQGYDRYSFHPYGAMLDYVEITVIAHNPFKKGTDPSTSIQLVVNTPIEPSLSVPDFASETGKLSCEMKRVDVEYSEYRLFNYNGPFPKEWHQNVYRVVRTSSSTGQAEQVLREWDFTFDDITRIEVQVPDAQALSSDQWVKVEFQAYSEGLAGSRAITGTNTRSPISDRFVPSSVSKDGLSCTSRVFAHPPLAKINRVHASSRDFSTGFVTVEVAVKATEYAPLDSVSLERLHNTAAATAEAAAQSSGWETVATVQTDAITAFSDTVAAALPNRGYRTWYRVVTAHDTYTRMSAPVECRELYRDANILTDDHLRIDACVSGDDGKSAKVTMGWTGTDWTGIELSWSEDPNAWESTEQPTTFEVTWADPSATSAVAWIRGLTEGTPYYIKARLYLDSEDYRQYGDYANAQSSWPVVPVTAPSDVRLLAPSFVERGREIPVSWTYQGEAAQKEWALYRTDGTRIVAASGEDSLGACTLPASAYGTADSITLQASLTTGGEWGFSQEVTVGIADAPTLELAEIQDLTANAFSIGVACSVPSFGLSVAVRSLGCATALPDGRLAQPAGEIVWSTYAEPSPSAGQDGYEATVEAPGRLAFVDGCRYGVTVVATDLFTGLQSDYGYAEFGVDWAHKASLPASVAVVPDRDELSCSVTVAAPSGAAESDVFDLYRVTPDGAQLCGSTLSFGTEYVDAYAPVTNEGGVAYRVCVRTEDGSLAWDDHPYELDSPGMRIDWDGGSLELPYNLDLEDGFAKDFELRRHLDGTSIGCWNEGAEVHGSASSQVARDLDADRLEAARALARHAGPAFVRTPDGCAYAADVQVGRIRRPYGSAARDVKLAMTRVPLPEAFTVTEGE